MSTKREYDANQFRIQKPSVNNKKITLEEAERLEKKKKLKEQLGLSSDSSEACMIILFYCSFYLFREEGEKERVAIVTYKENLPIQEIRNQIIMCLMSSSLRIKNCGAIAWLIDNCGFSFLAENFDSNHVMCIQNIMKGDLVFHDDDNSIDFHSTCNGNPISTTIYFKLYGSLGLKVYDSIKALQSNHESYGHYFYQVVIPDLDNAVWTREFRRQRCSEVMEFLLHREHPEFDFSKREDLLDFFYSCLQKLYQYGTSYTNTLDLNWETFKHGVEVQIANRDLQVKKSYVRYLYHKKQYLLAKKNKPVAVCKSRDIEKQTGDLFDENQLYISSKYNTQELKLMYKIAKQSYLDEKRNRKDKNVLCLGQLIEIPTIRRLIYWIRSKVIRDWFKENHWDVDYLFIGL